MLVVAVDTTDVSVVEVELAVLVSPETVLHLVDKETVERQVVLAVLLVEMEVTKVVVQDYQVLVLIVLTGLLLLHSVIQIMVTDMHLSLLYIIMTTGPLEAVVVEQVDSGVDLYNGHN